MVVQLLTSLYTSEHLVSELVPRLQGLWCPECGSPAYLHGENLGFNSR
jgi:hypothetical protein